MSYITAHKTQLLDTLENQVLYADLSSVIIADNGMGKTFFVNQLTKRLEQQVYISQIEAGVTLTPQQLEKSISLQLGLSWQSAEQGLLDKIKENTEQRVLITIDDAHLLSTECLNYLLTIAHPGSVIDSDLVDSEKRVYLVLAGESKLAKLLNQTSLLKQEPNLCVVFELKKIEIDETKRLIADYDSIKVSKAEKLFDPQKLEYFWQLSRGNPGELKKQLARWQIETDSLASKISPKVNLPLFEPSEAEAKHSSSDKEPAITQPPIKSFVTKESEKSSGQNYLLIAGYSLIAVILLLGLIYQDEINQHIMPTKPATAELNQSELSQNKTADVVKSDRIKTKAESEKNTNKDLVSDYESDSKQIAPKNILDQSEQEPTEKSIDNRAETELPPIKQQPIEIKHQPAITETQTKVETELTGNELIEPKPALPKKSEPEHNKLKLSDDEKLLLSKNSNQFTLQWLAVSNIKSAQSFIDKHPLKSTMRIFRRKQKDSYLYLVVAGDYNSHIDADNARATYILRGYQGKPWIKSFAVIIDEIEQLNSPR